MSFYWKLHVGIRCKSVYTWGELFGRGTAGVHCTGMIKQLVRHEMPGTEIVQGKEVIPRPKKRFK